VESGRNTPISDTEVHTQPNDCEEDDRSSEDNVDDAINRDIAAREPPRVSTSLSRTTSTVKKHRRSIHLSENFVLEDIPPVPKLPSSPPLEDLQQDMSSAAFMEIQRKLEKATKRQSITARFLSSIGSGVATGNIRPSLDHVMNSFHEMAQAAGKPVIAQQQSTSPMSVMESKPPPSAQPLKLTIDIAPPLNQQRENPPAAPSPMTYQQKENHTEAILTPKIQQQKELVISNSPLKQVQQEDEVDPKLENALADLDGVTILLDSVLETYLATVKLVQNQNSLSIIENKLNDVVEKISKTIVVPQPTKPTTTATESPETIQLLEKYSSLLINMVENKMTK
jgi:hypothetical protein